MQKKVAFLYFKFFPLSTPIKTIGLKSLLFTDNSIHQYIEPEFQNLEVKWIPLALKSTDVTQRNKRTFPLSVSYAVLVADPKLEKVYVG